MQETKINTEIAKVLTFIEQTMQILSIKVSKAKIYF